MILINALYPLPLTPKPLGDQTVGWGAEIPEVELHPEALIH